MLRYFSFCQRSVYITSWWQGGVSGAVANIYLTDILGFGKVSGALRNGSQHKFQRKFIIDNYSGITFTSDRVRDPIVRTPLPCLRDGIFH